MSRTVYALLVGIDNYPPPVSPLRGCVNDILRMEAFLRARVTDDYTKLKQPRVLLDKQATRKNIIKQFQSYLTQAGPDDVALFYYSGHGSQSPSPPEFWRLEPDHLDETLVCYDSRLPGGCDLADKELASLIALVAQKQPHIVVILDSCHSGSGTRNLDDMDVRRVPADTRVRPVDSFIGVENLLSSRDNPLSLVSSATGSDWFDLPVGRHVVLSACRSEELAREKILDGERRGVFSYYLLEALQQTGPSLTYRDLFNRVDARVRGTIALQSPQIEATDNQDLQRPFLGGHIKPRTSEFRVRYDLSNGWIVDAGAIHGIREGEDAERTKLALFSLTTSLDQMRSEAAILGQAIVDRVEPGQSRVTITLRDGSLPTEDQVFKAVVTAVPLPPLRVALSGHAPAIDLLREQLHTANIDGQASLFVREINATETDAQIKLVADEGHYYIQRIGNASPLLVKTKDYTVASARQAISQLEHIARWLNILHLDNPTSKLPSDAVRLEIYAVDPITHQEGSVPLADADLHMSYSYHQGQWLAPAFKLKLVNTTDQELYCIVLDLPETYAVSAGLLPNGRIKLGPQGTNESEAWAYKNKPIPLHIPKELQRQGVRRLRDVLKVLVSTADADGRLLEQPDLAVSNTRSQPRGDLRRNTLSRLMRRIPTRHLGDAPEELGVLADWRSFECSFTVSALH